MPKTVPNGQFKGFNAYMVMERESSDLVVTMELAGYFSNRKYMFLNVEYEGNKINVAQFARRVSAHFWDKYDDIPVEDRNTISDEDSENLKDLFLDCSDAEASEIGFQFVWIYTNLMNRI